MLVGEARLATSQQRPTADRGDGEKTYYYTESSTEIRVAKNGR